ncbi:MAG: hypothetical protein A3J38_09780 [Gammaproteobacteria bacterium RIFCSPHIGHO2_12_FULL_45_9]|nr:MAG: hypothetical protein A3J38_09780 [Gammaproteobacteria bacterium RIFCSPHIGHO2_12_FULL_45_9]
MADLSPHMLTTFSLHIPGLLSHGMAPVAHAANTLLYLFAAIEICLFGLLWALRGGEAVATALKKILWIALLYSAIANFNTIANYVIEGFSHLSSAAQPHGKFFLTHPDAWLKLGLTPAHAFITYATTKSDDMTLGLSLTYIFMGFGILLSCVIMTLQAILLVAEFYFSAWLGVIFVPLGVFQQTIQLALKPLQKLIQCAVKIAVFALTASLCFTFLTHQLPKKLILNSQFPIDQALLIMVFFIVAALLLWLLPKRVSELVGEFVWPDTATGETTVTAPVSVSVPPSPIPSVTAVAEAQTQAVSIDHATTVTPATTTVQTASTGGIMSAGQSPASSDAAAARLLAKAEAMRTAKQSPRSRS